MTPQSLTDKQLAELAEILELAKINEQKNKDLCELATEIAQKSKKRLHEARLAPTQN